MRQRIIISVNVCVCVGNWRVQNEMVIAPMPNSYFRKHTRKQKSEQWLMVQVAYLLRTLGWTEWKIVGMQTQREFISIFIAHIYMHTRVFVCNKMLNLFDFVFMSVFVTSQCEDVNSKHSP